MRSFFLLSLLAAGLSAQTFVDGHVFDSVTGAPVAGAYIQAYQGMPGDPMPVTDSAGHFHVESHDNRTFVMVKRNGYLDHREYFLLKPGPSPSEIRIVVIPQAVISGRVVDENGLAVRGARVAALQYQEVNGQRRLLRWRGGVDTNELGEYRIFGLPAGRYYLSVAPGKLAEWDQRYAPRFYPDEAEAGQAAPVDVRAGEERGGRDFRLTRQEGVTVAGRLVRPDAAPGKGASAQSVPLYLESTEHPTYSIPVTRTGGDGFSITHVPPGNYTLRTWLYTLRPRIGDLMGDLTLQVGKADMRDVRLEIRPIEEEEVTGTIEFMGRTKPGPMVVTLRRELGDPISVVSNADGTFVVKGVLPGPYYLDVRSAAADGVPRTDGIPIAAQLGTRDVLGQSFDIGTGPPGALKISVAATVAKLTGKLLDAAGRPVTGAMILFLSREGNIRSYGRSGENGVFTADIPAAGEHRIFVVPGDEEYSSFRDPEFLQLHQYDFPPVQVVEGANPPLPLRQPAQ